MLNNTSHAGKETANKNVFKREQKTGRVVADVTSVGRQFHKRLPRYVTSDQVVMLLVHCDEYCVHTAAAS